MTPTAAQIPNLTVDQIKAAALNLPPEVREQMVETLVASLPLDPEVEDAMNEEEERLFQACLAGEMEAFPAKQVIAEARARLARHRANQQEDTDGRSA